MAKTRILISLDLEDAERIRAVAAENGLGISAFLVMAGRKEAARRARIAESFADIDAAIAEVEAEADTLPWPPDGDVETEDMLRIEAEIAAARAAYAARRRGAADRRVESA
ncbi:hypothetical protein FBY35_2746 [Streptomyces sp. SLBN-118]|uniref:hypothetical protein n=1 Tax=Streptomyces sp. SLBN-118 TaxID=2768454 RepID=UPI0011513179|nr:hypothetical protein [Streptomyces sp. SLBN-118]TQK52315.1 hypothetical protein FBY35_2746 [Streptomyces sp. SLBN-118]